MWRNKIRWVLRVILAGLFIFEMANFLRLLDFVTSFTWLGLGIQSFFVLILIETIALIMRHRLKITLPWTVWLVGTIAIVYDFLGDFLLLYARFHWYDQLGHFIGTFCAAVGLQIIFNIVEKKYRWKVPKFLVPLTVFGIAATFGILYEIEEYLEDYFTDSNRLGDGFDTANDLLLNLVGATMVFTGALYNRYWKNE